MDPSRPAAAFQVELVEERSRVQVFVAGELDLVTAPVLDRHLDGAIGRGRNEIVVDVAAVTFIDVRGINSLVVAHQAAEEAGIPLVVRGAGDHLRRMIALCGLEHAVPLVG